MPKTSAVETVLLKKLRIIKEEGREKAFHCFKDKTESSKLHENKF
jgi:hypothetical protein